MRIFTRTIIAAIALPALVLAAAACGDDDDTAGNSAALQASITALQADIAESSTRVQRNEMLQALVTIDGLRLHEIDETLNEADGAIDPTFVPRTRLFVRMQSLTNWPDELAAEGQDVIADAVELLKALEDGDAQAAKGPATAVHEGSHEFNEQAWNIVMEGLPAAAGGPEVDEEEEGSETPEAGETPEPEATP